jgi:exodeoxyribonuclease V alpha subunit
VRQIVADALKRGTSIDDIQILAPMYNTTNGIDAINLAIQYDLHDEKEHYLEVGYKKFYKGDKILQLKNMNECNVVNGDTGYVKDIILKNEESSVDKIVVDYSGIMVDISRSDINYPVVNHGYCTSVHKSQGSEYKIVIMPIFSEYKFMLERKMLYTGVTRAKTFLIMLGDKEALKYAINKENNKIRKTGLLAKL